MGCRKLTYYQPERILKESSLFLEKGLEKSGKPLKMVLDYFTFGMTMPGRTFNSSEYRYGFQGQEKDDEIKGEGNSINFKYRVQDPRLGRFFSIDPLTRDYPFYTPYSFSGNRVIDSRELEGLEPAQEIYGPDGFVPVLVIPASDNIPVPVQPGGLDHINNGGKREKIESSPLDYLMNLLNRGLIVNGNGDGSDSPGSESSVPPAGSIDFGELSDIFSLLGIATKGQKANSLNKSATPDKAAKIANKYKDVGKSESANGEDIIGPLRPDQGLPIKEPDSATFDLQYFEGNIGKLTIRKIAKKDTSDGKVKGSQYNELDGARILFLK